MTLQLGSRAARGVALAAGCLAVACGPRSDKVLVVYSSLPAEVVNSAEDSFEEIWSDVDVRVIRMDDAEAIERIKSGRGEGDVWWGASSSTLTEAARDTLLASFRPSWVEAGSDIAGIDAEERWQVAMVSPFVIAFNREETPLSRAPRDWVDVHHARWRGEVTLLDPALNPAGADFVTGFVGANLSDGNDVQAGFDRLLRMDAAVESYVGDAEEAVRALGSGDVLLAVLPLHEVERLRHDNAEWLHYRHPESGAPALLRGVAMMYGAPEPDMAKEFIEMVGSSFATDVTIQTWWLPSRAGLLQPRLPEDHLVPGTAMPWFRLPATTGSESAAWVERWESEVRGKGRNLY
jgi:iron(III) transport system substrate-binding protein